MISYQQFIADFPAFNTNVYPESQFNFAASVAVRMLTPAWGAPADPGQPPTDYDLGYELLIAHLMTLWAQAGKPAASGGFAGLTTGLVSGKTVGQVSLTYDVSAAILEDAGAYNLTIYGIQFFQMAELIGSAPMQFSPGGCVTPYNGLAWSGLVPYPGWFG